MKVSNLISVLQNIVDNYGDKEIWQADFDAFPLPDKFKFALTDKIEVKDYTIKSGNENVELVTILDYEDDEFNFHTFKGY